MEFQDTRFLLCSLIPEKIEQHIIDITCLKGEKILFRSVGPNGVHLMGNYVSQDDSESESDEEEEVENVNITDSFGYTAEGSVGRYVKGSIGDSDNDLYLDAPDELDDPDILNEIVPNNDEFDIGYICNFLETTFGSKEPFSDLDDSSNISDSVTIDQNPDQYQKSTSPLMTPILVELAENTDKYKSSRKGNAKKQERVAERLEVERLEVEKLEVERGLTEKRRAKNPRGAKMRENEKQVTEMQDAENRKIEKLESERVEAEKLKAEKLKADKLITEKLKAEKLKAEKRVPKKRVHTRREYVVPETVELENPTPKNSIGSAGVKMQVVYGFRPKRTSRSQTQKLSENQINLADIKSESDNDQVKSNDVPGNVDTNRTTKAEVPPSEEVRNSKVKNRSANSSVEQTQVEQNPVEQKPTESLLEETAPVRRNSRKPRTPVAMNTRSSIPVYNAPRPRIPIASRTRSKSPVAKKILNIPVESIPTETNEETGVEEPISKMNSRAKKPKKKIPVKETPVEHIKEVDSIAPSTETTPIKRPKRRKLNALKEKDTSNNLLDKQLVVKSEEIITSSNLENTNIEPVEIEQTPSKKRKDSENKHVEEPVKQIEKTVSQEEHIEIVSSESTEEIRVEETRSNEQTQDINAAEKLSKNTKNTKLKKIYQNIPTEEGTKGIEAEIPNVETTSKKKKTKINKNTSTTRKRFVEDVSQETPTENSQDGVQKNNDELESPTVSDLSLTNKRAKIEDTLKETVTEEKSIGDDAYSFEELLRRERERKRLSKLKKKNDKQKKRGGYSPKESSKSQKDIDAPASTPAANSTKGTFKKQSNAKSPAVKESSAQQSLTPKRKGVEESTYNHVEDVRVDNFTPGTQRKKNVQKKRKL
ncbi:hypothetical protein INT48_000033 [Thamnidium elegans]|uniref:Nucleoplasmin-like domain-containing protein n=1 Tax=Thamnidium elegans TaxID=101142 RepID=A0A8H7SK48_9FUNG|nr:hypothetical protein INT48_000033 [Thamnidium elegans]